MTRGSAATPLGLGCTGANVNRKVTAAGKVTTEAPEAHSSAKSDFIAMVSHEFRTPLHGIIGHAQLLELTSLSNEQATYLRHLRASTAGLLDLVESTLDVSRIEAGDSPVQRSPTNLRECVLECLTMIEVQVRARGIRLLAHVDPALPASVSMDRKSVREVLLNLTGNAVKFTDSGSVEVTVSYRDPGPVGFRLVFSISDSGIGIAKENFDRVFAKFSQVHEGSTRPATGAGLGTTIARDLARRMGGDITLDSDLGRGSTLAFDIPVEGSLVIPPRAGRLGTVMLAGAVDAALDPLIASLRALGCETTVATEVTVAIGIINATASPPEWVFVPESLGIAAAQRIAQAAQARAGDRADLCRLIVLTRASAMSAEFAHAGFSGSMRRGASQSEVAATLMGRLAPEGPTPTTVRVPVQTPAPPEAPDGDDLLARLVAELKPIQYVKVLLVDDNSVSRLMISTWLEKLGIEHSVAKYAYEFLEMAADVSFDLFLIDQHMPDLDGIEALNLYRTAAADPVVPALLVTADVKEETVQHALRAGFACVVPKPMDIEVLVHAMVQAFAPPSERPQPEQLQAAVQARAWSLNAPRGGEAEDLIDARQIMNATSIPSGDVTEFARNLIHGYAQDAWIMFAGMTDALSRSDFTALRDHAETLKGSSRSVGATAVARLCADMASTPTDTLRSQGAQMIATIEDTVRRSVAAFEAATSKRN